MPKVSRVLLLMTFTPDSPSITVPAISLSFIITVIAGLLVSTNAGPSSGLEKNDGAGAGFGLMTVAWRSVVNRGTNWSRRANGSTIWHSCNACQVGLSSVCLTASSGYAFWSSISATFFRIASWVSHSATFPFDRVVTCCMSVTSAMTILTAGCFSLALSGHWLL